jgi:hypothetical protein
VTLPVGEAGITNPGMVIGTPMYMAPEQAQGEPLDGRADLFSLGCVLYLMITGRPPFEGKTTLAVLTAVISQTPLPASQFNPAVPNLLTSLLSRLLAKEPRDRPTSAVEVGEELQAIGRAGILTVSGPAPVDTIVTPLGQGVAPADLLWSGIQPQPGSPSAETSSPSSSILLQSRSSESLELSRRTARGPERRQVTVLVCGGELFESETYLTLDTEDQAQILHAFQRTGEHAVRHFDGTVVQCNEHGLLACFGFPVAHEDATRTDVPAGLRISLQESLVHFDELTRFPATGCVMLVDGLVSQGLWERHPPVTGAAGWETFCSRMNVPP